ncbi:MAG: inner membrane protein [Arenicella sp.]|jgi:inner membrane protein
MDPLTQGVVGAAASQLVSRRVEKIAAGVIGFFSGMAADLDVLISSPTDPLLFLEFHRHFTHALIFIPIGALICTLAFRAIFRRWFKRNQLSFQRTYLFSFAGYATHAVIDACTTYGTQLFWPFSDMRVAWNNVSVIDPLFSLPLLIITALAVFKRSTAIAVLGSVYAFAYLGLGLLQNHRVSDVAEQLAISRGHVPSNLGVKPSFANIVVWKSVYEYQGRYYVDAVRMLGSAKVYPGTSVEKLDISKHFSWLDNDFQQAQDIQRFRWFSNDHLALDPSNSKRIIDVRYSLIPNQVTGMWGITLNRFKDQVDHVEWSTNRPKGAEAMSKAAELLDMVLGR